MACILFHWMECVPGHDCGLRQPSLHFLSDHVGTDWRTKNNSSTLDAFISILYVPRPLYHYLDIKCHRPIVVEPLNEVL
jgi:hypothetical protein